MIFDTIPFASCYRSLTPSFDQAFAWLEAFRPDLADGRYKIQGDLVFALVQSYETVSATEKKFESHRAYADIQYVASGAEIIYYEPVGDLQPVTAYDAEKDFRLYVEPATSLALLMKPGSFAVFFPQDGHKPGCIDEAVTRMKKVVVKVAV